MEMLYWILIILAVGALVALIEGCAYLEKRP